MANIAPVRARTDPPSPDHKRTERSHLHKRLHASTITGSRSHHHRPRTRDTAHSAVELKPPISFDHILRRDKKSPDSSRRGSTAQHQPHPREANESRPEQRELAQRVPRPQVTQKDVAQAKDNNAKREAELRSRLQSVEEMGMSSTRQLDDTYYAILEKASMLRSTVASLQQLAEHSRRMHSSFQAETEDLETETRQNLNAFNNFEQQEISIQGLVRKLQHSKGETDKLNARLEQARNRIEVYEEREQSKRTKRRKQWQATWGTLLGVFLLVIVIAVLKNHRNLAYKLDGFGKTLADVGDLAEGAGVSLSRKLRPTSSPSEDPYLKKLFDEL